MNILTFLNGCLDIFVDVLQCDILCWFLSILVFFGVFGLIVYAIDWRSK